MFCKSFHSYARPVQCPQSQKYPGLGLSFIKRLLSPAKTSFNVTKEFVYSRDVLNARIRGANLDIRFNRRSDRHK
ncbi:hypothetical protein J6590_028127 [Homalodisca vitripennis]|nr:hypothetical protein J6590_028127 [Homalodisca vitripennis]